MNNDGLRLPCSQASTVLAEIPEPSSFAQCEAK
jgi:hypothetical protein